MTGGLDVLIDAPDTPRATLLFAHGSGAPMDSDNMTMASQALVSAGLRVVRFEFGYMAARRQGGSKRPPPKADKLIPEYRRAIEAHLDTPLIIGGKSMGGRVASMIADELYAPRTIAGLFCLGYPFHPPAKPDALRTAHLLDMQCPALVCQGTRDPFGTAEEVPAYALPPTIRVAWFEDGDHDLKPRKRISGLSHADHMHGLTRATSAWLDHLRL